MSQSLVAPFSEERIKNIMDMIYEVAHEETEITLLQVDGSTSTEKAAVERRTIMRCRFCGYVRQTRVLEDVEGALLYDGDGIPREAADNHSSRCPVPKTLNTNEAYKELLANLFTLTVCGEIPDESGRK